LKYTPDALELLRVDVVLPELAVLVVLVADVVVGQTREFLLFPCESVEEFVETAAKGRFPSDEGTNETKHHD